MHMPVIVLILLTFSVEMYFFYCGRRQTIKVNMNEWLEIQSSLQILLSNTINAEGMVGKLRHDFWCKDTYILAG